VNQESGHDFDNVLLGPLPDYNQSPNAMLGNSSGPNTRRFMNQVTPLGQQTRIVFNQVKFNNKSADGKVLPTFGGFGQQK